MNIFYHLKYSIFISEGCDHNGQCIDKDQSVTENCVTSKCCIENGKAMMKVTKRGIITSFTDR